MDRKTQARFEARTRIIKALAHPSRLFMAQELVGGEQCVCKLTEKVGADISTVSKHLAVLKAAGIVEDEKRGMQVYYKLTDSEVSRFIRDVDVVSAHIAHRQVELLRAV